MATSGNYTEMTDQYLLTENINGITCTRVYHDGASPAVSGSLPDIGDSLDPTSSKYKDVLVVETQKRKFGGHPSKNVWTIAYSSNPVQQELPEAESSALPTSGSVGGEIISIDNETSGYFTWNSDSAVIKQQMPKRVPSGAFRISRRIRILPLDKFSEYCGYINSASLKVVGGSYAAGLVMFTGMTYEEYKNNFGLRRWKIEYSFEWKCIPLGTTPETYGGWLYLFRESTGKFELVTPALYPSRDLNKLFGDPSNL